MKKKIYIIIILLCIVGGLYYMLSQNLSGAIVVEKLNLENADKVVVLYDKGEMGKQIELEEIPVDEEQRQQLMEYLSSLKLKKHEDDYMEVDSFERYLFDFQFTDENRRITIDLHNGEYIKFHTFGNGHEGVLYRIKN